MCRHFAYVGEPVTIKSVLLDPPHSLVEQAWSPRRQKHGTMNVDGFGVGWYAAADPVPARYRRAGPIWSDDCLADLARVTSTRAMLCAVRSASVGTDTGASAASPYTYGKWLFSLNGALVGWSAAAGGSTTRRRRAVPAPAPGILGAAAGSGAAGASGTYGAAGGGAAEPAETAAAAALALAEAAGEPLTEPHPVPGPVGLDEAADAVLRLAGLLPAADLLRLQARCDTALIWAMVLTRLQSGDEPADALAGTLADLAAAGAAGRFNLLLTDGEVIAATAAGDSLCYLRWPGGVIVASEPSDDDPAWQDVPDGSVVEATPAGVAVRPLPMLAPQSVMPRPAEPASPPIQEATSP